MDNTDKKFKRWITAKEREFQRGDTYKVASRFDLTASRVLAGLESLDMYTLDEVRQIISSPEGRAAQLSNKMQRIQEVLGQLHTKWVSADVDDRTIDAAPLIEVLPPKKDADRVLDMN